MSRQPEQNFANHARYVPAFHFIAFPALVLNLLWSGYWLWRQLHYWAGKAAAVDAGVRVVTAIALLIVFFCARIFALTAQDRVIRLEERLRLERLLPGELKARIGELTIDQLVALRFAADEELPALARTVIEEGLQERAEIKKRVRAWRADHLRV